jgi:hypothetical protein
MRFYLIVHSAARPIVCRDSGAITLLVANITPTADLGGGAQLRRRTTLGSRRRCILRFPAVRHGGENFIKARVNLFFGYTQFWGCIRKTDWKRFAWLDF